ncbi:MAG TPA: transposase [Pyrinomonadaceae bacterium]|jgi:transposase|nr:transposase [Pyrinomonadaceae bacterium]
MRQRSSFHLQTKKMGLAKRVNAQLDLFDHGVLVHGVTANLLCIRHAPKARCMMRQTTYSQEWSAYNQAQVNEKSQFQSLLYELCQNLVEPIQHMGRPRVPLADRIYAAVFKTYSTVSCRRFMSDLQEATRRGYLSMMPHYNSIFRYLESEELTAYLRQLIIESSLPLKCVEFDFAVDSSGFCTGQYGQWLTAKYGAAKIVNKENWLKVHLMCGVKTNIVTSVEVTSRNAGDSPQFAPLVEQTSRNFVMNQVSADKAYSSSKNLSLVLVKGAQPFIAFRNNANATGKQQSAVWKRMFHLYQYNQDEFMRHYHKRSNVETTFSMIKAKFGERLRSKSHTAQVNEVLCKILCHNLCCVVQSIYELGIEPTFLAE